MTHPNECPNGHQWQAPAFDDTIAGVNVVVYYEDHGGFCPCCGAAGMGTYAFVRLFSY